MSSKKIFSAISEKSKTFTFDIEPTNFFCKILQKLKIKPLKRTIEVKPIKYGVRAVCATYVNSMSFDKYSNKSISNATSQFAENELNNLFMYLAYVLWNKESMPPSWLIKGVRSKDQAGIDEIIEFVKSSLDTQAFLNSIISLVGMSLQTEEIIASENESQEHTK